MNVVTHITTGRFTNAILLKSTKRTSHCVARSKDIPACFRMNTIEKVKDELPLYHYNIQQ